MTKILTHEQLSDATQLKKGIARFATEQEAIDQLLNNVIISPATLKIALDNRQATEEILGMAKFASSAEAVAGENSTKMISPLTAKKLINSYGLGHTSAKALPDNDLNKAIEIGFYAVNTETLNKPSGFPDFGSVITSNHINNTRSQILFDTTSGTGVPNGPWIRKTADYESNTINWGTWYKLTNDSHTHSGYVPLAGGTMTGILYPQNNTSYTTGQARRIILSTDAPSGGGNGDVWIKYTA